MGASVDDVRGRPLHDPVIRLARCSTGRRGPGARAGRTDTAGRQAGELSGMDAVAIVLALATFALMLGLIRAMDRI
jgi:hypothetical protein